MTRTYRLMIAATILLIIGSLHEARAQDCIYGYTGTPAPILPRWAQGSIGHHVYYWCQRPDGQVSVNGFSCSYAGPASCSAGALLSALQVIADSPSPASAAQAALATSFTYACNDAVRAEQTDRGALCRERKALYIANMLVWLKGLKLPAAPAPAPLAPAYTHFVKVNGTTTTRPAYALTNGVRGTKEVARATVGQPCKNATGTADQWLTFGPNFAADVVAICARSAASP